MIGAEKSWNEYSGDSKSKDAVLEENFLRARLLFEQAKQDRDKLSRVPNAKAAIAKHDAYLLADSALLKAEEVVTKSTDELIRLESALKKTQAELEAIEKDKRNKQQKSISLPIVDVEIKRSVFFKYSPLLILIVLFYFVIYVDELE